jgi:hypothetical protein
MSLSIPRKKKKIIILIIVSSRIDEDLNSVPVVEGTVFETIGEQMARAQTVLFDVPESSWGTAEDDAWIAAEAIHNQLLDELDVAKLQDLSDAFQSALDAL